MKYFSTDGIRFKYNEEAKLVIKRLGNALGIFKNNIVIIGHDTRDSSQEILDILSGAIFYKNVVYVGIISTPGIGYLSKEYHAIGLSLTASHNDESYNGIKIFINGEKLSLSFIKKLEKKMDYYENPHYEKRTLMKKDYLINDYLNFLLSFKDKMNPSVYDASNGGTIPYIDKIIKEYHQDNNSINLGEGKINDQCGSTFPLNIIPHLDEIHQLGYLLDGDGDRLILQDQSSTYTGEKIIYIFAKYFKYKKVVLTKASSLGLRKSLRDLGVKIYYSNPSDTNVYYMMKKTSSPLGGEESGHIILSSYLSTGDGLLNALILSTILYKQPLSSMLSTYISSYDEMISIPCIDNYNYHLYLDEYLKSLKKYKDILYVYIRLGKTENKLRVFISSYSFILFNQVKQQLINLIKITMYKINCDNISNKYIDQDSTFEESVNLFGDTHIINSHIGKGVTIKSSYVQDSTIGSNCIIGPYAHIRSSSIVEDNIRIGNFVEIKKSHIRNNTKISHLSYIGDAFIGKYCNIGCGVTTANYDGLKKHPTHIGNNTFIGCNTSLIAPINIGNDCYIACDSTITSSIVDKSFVISRNKQNNYENTSIKYPYYKNIHSKKE